MEFKVDGILFTTDRVDDRFTRGVVRCPTCRNQLEQQVSSDGSAYLICSTPNQGCVNPAKSFAGKSQKEEWLESSWQVVERRCMER